MERDRSSERTKLAAQISLNGSGILLKNKGGYTLNETPKASRIEPPKAARGEGNGGFPPPQPTRESGGAS